MPRDYAEAARWFGKAADAGHTEAQFNLGLMYDNGQGVVQDYVLAHFWLNLAASSSSGEDQKRRVKARDEVAKKLTPRQLEDVQRLAREWRPENEMYWSLR